MKNVSRYLGLFGIILFCYIISRIDINEVTDAIQTANPVFILLVLVINPFILLLRSLRWKTLIELMGSDMSLKDTCFIWSKGVFWGLITPGKVGDLIRAKYLRDRNDISMGKAMSSVIIDRIMDMILVVILGLSGALVLISALNMNISLVLLSLSSLSFILFLYLSTKENFMKKALKPFFNILVPQNFKKEAQLNFHEFYNGIRSIKQKTFILLISYTLIAWITTYFTFWLLSLSLGLDLPFWYILASAPLISLVGLLPVSISGLGTREAACIFLFSFMYITPEQSVSFSLLVLVITSWTFALPAVVLYLAGK